MEIWKGDWHVDTEGLVYLSCLEDRPNCKVYTCEWRNEVICVKILNYIAQEELHVLSKCVHPKVCQFLGGCVKDGKTYIFMEHMENGNLIQYMKMRELSLHERIVIGIQIAKAIQYLFDRKPNGILHRDIKPENILVNRYGVCKLSDFGISKLIFTKYENKLYTHTGEIGTYRWTAPEILASKRYDNKSDIYAFGFLLRFIVTNTIPYAGYENTIQIMYAKYNKIDDCFDDIQCENLKTFIKKCTAYDPMNRPAPSEIITFLVDYKNTL